MLASYDCRMEVVLVAMVKLAFDTSLKTAVRTPGDVFPRTPLRDKLSDDKSE